MRNSTIIAFAAVSLALSGCGYHLGAVKPAELRNVTTIAVPTFKNKTLEPRVEVLMADTLIKQLQQDGTYEVVSDDKADVILYCTFDKIERSQARAVPNNVLATREFNLLLEVEYELIDRVTGRRIDRSRVSVYTSFFINNDLQTDERQAIVTAIQRVATDITGKVTEGF